MTAGGFRRAVFLFLQALEVAIVMTYEAQIVLRRDNPRQLADDVEAISEFIEERRRASPSAPREARRPHLKVVSGESAGAA